ncbi:phospholipase, partial [Candidatus Woesearchaeota archaeon]|nr:phospholipase [Candidatus Woesearchaeota archaeon]
MKKRRPKIGLALGAGGARGFTHIGVLKVLEKNKIFPDYIAGTSMGAVMAAAYAAGRSTKDIESIVMHTDWRKIVD